MNTELLQRAKELLHEIETQDNRCTRTPIYYEIHGYKWEIVPEGCHDDVGFRYDSENVVYGLEDALKLCMEWLSDDEESEENERSVYLKEKIASEEELDEYDIEDLMEERDYEKFYCAYEGSIDHFAPIFFTEKEANAYIKRQAHNLGDKPFTYVKCAYETNSIKTMIEVLKEYVGETK